MPANISQETPQGPGLLYRREEDYFTVKRLVESFLQTLRHIDLLSRAGWRQREPPLKTTTAFELGGPLHSLLAPASLQKPPIGGVEIHEKARIGCLLLICQSLLNLNAPSRAGDDYMAEVEAVLQSVEISAKTSYRAFLHFDLRIFLHLLLKIRYPSTFDRHSSVQQSYEHSQVTKRLSGRSRSKVGELLLDCIASNRIGQSQPRITDMEADAIRHEALWFQCR
jgi:hypothetical protein